MNCLMKSVIRQGLRCKFKSVMVQCCHLKCFPILFPKKKTSDTKVCSFHMTSPRNALPPTLLVLFRFVGKFGAAISGKIIRKWWSKLSPQEKAKFLQKLRSRKSKLAFAGTVFTGFSYLVYLEHIVEDPITKRKKFMIISEIQIMQLAEYEYKRHMQMFQSAVVPFWHPMYRRVLRVANNLLHSNLEYPQVTNRDWAVVVIDSPNITNAFALPNGKIFVFTGMLNLCTNDDQLAFILAHEIAHCILSHVTERVSKIFIVEFIFLIPTVVIWTIFPMAWALFSEGISFYLAKIFIHLPFSRSIEREADMVGLKLAAKSCYDVREAPALWRKMKLLGLDNPLEWLSTHPKYESRQIELQEAMPEALYWREKSKCPPLSKFWLR